jgi:hypothetical protein
MHTKEGLGEAVDELGLGKFDINYVIWLRKSARKN